MITLGENEGSERLGPFGPSLFIDCADPLPGRRAQRGSMSQADYAALCKNTADTQKLNQIRWNASGYNPQARQRWSPHAKASPKAKAAGGDKKCGKGGTKGKEAPP